MTNDGRVPSPSQQLAAGYVQLVRRGRRQAELVKVMMERLADGSDDLARGGHAASVVARFVANEGWVVGDFWRGRGQHLLFHRWALEHDIPGARVRDHLARMREDNVAGRTADRSASDESRQPDPTTPSRPGGTQGVSVPRGASHPDRSSGSGHDRRNGAARAADHGAALGALFDHLLGTDRSTDAAFWAAQRTMQFAVDEGWARGPLWLAYGPQLLLAVWALEHGVTSSDVESAMAQHRQAAMADDPSGRAEA